MGCCRFGHVHLCAIKTWRATLAPLAPDRCRFYPLSILDAHLRSIFYFSRPFIFYLQAVHVWLSARIELLMGNSPLAHATEVRSHDGYDFSLAMFARFVLHSERKALSRSWRA